MENIVVTLENQIKTALEQFIDHQNQQPSKNLSVNIERPKNTEHGDFATNIAFQVSKEYSVSPMQAAETISQYIDI